LAHSLNPKVCLQIQRSFSKLYQRFYQTKRKPKKLEPKALFKIKSQNTKNYINHFGTGREEREIKLLMSFVLEFHNGESP
jgi:hypothetical protein